MARGISPTFDVPNRLCRYLCNKVNPGARVSVLGVYSIYQATTKRKQQGTSVRSQQATCPFTA